MNTPQYEAMKRPPVNALKQIKGGRISGMTDISPQWRIEILDSTFGLCGIGWKYEIIRLWTEQATEDQVACFAQISLYVKDEDFWSDAIPGIGGSMFITKENNSYAKDNEPKFKMYVSDEGYKMAVTDALSVACKMLGVGADIYRGRWDGSKYRDEPKEAPVQVQTKQAPKKTDPLMADLAQVMATKKADGSDYFDETMKAGYRKQVGLYGVAKTLENATIRLEELQSAEGAAE